MAETCSIDINPANQPTDEATFEPGPGKHILYFGDPMCSWCWGFTPELAKISSALKGRAQLQLVMGGLRPGTADAWDTEMRGFIRHHWEEVEKKTGQPFDYGRFDDENFIYDTEPSCRALVVGRELNPDLAVTLYEGLQRGFYAEGRDITGVESLADMAQEAGLDRNDFIAAFNAPSARASIKFDFNRTRSFGVTGFPSVLCAEDGQYGFLTLGYRPFDAMGPLLEEWLNA